MSAHLFLSEIDQNEVFYDPDNGPQRRAKKGKHGKGEHVEDGFRDCLAGRFVAEAHPHAPVRCGVQVQNENQNGKAAHTQQEHGSHRLYTIGSEHQ